MYRIWSHLGVTHWLMVRIGGSLYMNVMRPKKKRTGIDEECSYDRYSVCFFWIVLRHNWNCPDMTSPFITFNISLITLLPPSGNSDPYLPAPTQLQESGVRPTTALSWAKEWIFWNSPELCFTLAHWKHQLCDMCNCFKTFGPCAQYSKVHTIAEGFFNSRNNCQWYRHMDLWIVLLTQLEH